MSMRLFETLADKDALTIIHYPGSGMKKTDAGHRNDLITSWYSSEKMEAGIDDVISVEYTQINVVYEYETSTSTGVRGDVNADGSFTLADVVMLQKQLLDAGKITNAQADDFCVMKCELLQK